MAGSAEVPVSANKKSVMFGSEEMSLKVEELANFGRVELPAGHDYKHSTGHTSCCNQCRFIGVGRRGNLKLLFELSSSFHNLPAARAAASRHTHCPCKLYVEQRRLFTAGTDIQWNCLRLGFGASKADNLSILIGVAFSRKISKSTRRGR